MWWEKEGVPSWGVRTHSQDAEFFFFNIFVLGYMNLICYDFTGNVIDLVLLDRGFFNPRQIFYKLQLIFSPSQIKYKYFALDEEEEATMYVIQDPRLLDYVYMLMRKMTLKMTSKKRKFHWMNIVHKVVRKIPSLATLSKAAIPLGNGESYLRRYITCPFDIVQKVVESAQFNLPWPKVAQDFYYDALMYNIGIKCADDFNRNESGLYTYKYPFFGKYSASANALMLPRMLLVEGLICHRSRYFQKAGYGLYNGATEDFRFAFVNCHKIDFPQQLLFYSTLKTKMAFSGIYDPTCYCAPLAPQSVPHSSPFWLFDEAMLDSRILYPLVNPNKVRIQPSSLRTLASEAFVVKFSLANVLLLSKFITRKYEQGIQEHDLYRTDLMALDPVFKQIRIRFQDLLLHTAAKDRYTRVDIRGQAKIFADDWVLDFVSDVIDSHGANSSVDMFYLGEIYGECSDYWENLSMKSVKELEDWPLLSL